MPAHLTKLKEPKSTARSVTWKRSEPNQLAFHDPRHPDIILKRKKLSQPQMKLLTDSAKLSIQNPSIGFYEPKADMSPHPASRRLMKHPFAWPEEHALKGTLELWGPAVPGDSATQPEPREILFAGESGFLIINMVNGNLVPITITSASVRSQKLGVAEGRTRMKVAIPAQSEGVYKIPLAVDPAAPAGFLGLQIRIASVIDGREAAIRRSVHITVGRLEDFSQEVEPVDGDPNAHQIHLSLTADVPGGFKEKVSSTLLVQTHVGHDSAVNFHVLPLDYQATVFLGSTPASPELTMPQNLYFSFAMGSVIGDIAKRVFQTATAAIMAALATAGVAATKVLIAAAAQALGPAIGVPVTLVLYSPPIEAWFAKAATVILGSTGWILNGELYDEIFG